jgi:uncharacterized membrane protein YdfJ with MMPL/SSD domain
VLDTKDGCADSAADHDWIDPADAYLHACRVLGQSLTAAATVVIIAAVAMPVFARLGFGTAASAALGLACGVLVVAALVLRAWIADVLFKRRCRRRPPERREPPSGG